MIVSQALEAIYFLGMKPLDIKFCQLDSSKRGFSNDIDDMFAPYEQYLLSLSIDVDGNINTDAGDRLFDWVSKNNVQPDLLILFTRTEQLFYSENYTHIAESSYRRVTAKGFCPPPIITIGTEQIMEAPNDNVGSTKIFDALRLDPRYRFLDSSIWHRYVSIDQHFDRKICSILKEILFYHEHNIYATDVAKEFIEFQTRVMANSHLDLPGGHASHVTPFIFHSESQMRSLARKQGVIHRELPNLKWRMLMVDDHVKEKKLKTSTAVNNAKCDLSKGDIVNHLLNEGAAKSKFLIEPASTVDSAIGKLTNGTFDIILLDYLLDIVPESGSSKMDRPREYGNELLECITGEGKVERGKSEMLQQQRGPINHYWIFPVSVFYVSMLDKLREQGIGHINKYWYMSRGADPVNTPQLFLYNFHSFLNLQINEVLPQKSEVIDFMKDNPIRERNDLDGHDVKSWAQRVYGSFIYRFRKSGMLVSDCERKSLFAESMLSLLEESTAETMIVEYMENLLYLLAYGTKLDWPQMWEAFTLVAEDPAVKEVIIKQSGLDQSGEKPQGRDFKASHLNPIMNYINRLSER